MLQPIMENAVVHAFEMRAMVILSASGLFPKMEICIFL